MLIQAQGFTEAYIKMCQFVMNTGTLSSPRGMQTKEIIGGVVKVSNPRTRLIQSEIRKLSLPFAIGEWLWCMQGRDDLSMIQYYAPSYYKYSDDGLMLHGAYGPRIFFNLQKVVKMLKDDKQSRRAVIPIYQSQDVALDSNDIPCTISLQFIIRDNELNLIVNMRSNDIYLGFPYDIFNFTMCQEYVATKLDLDMGEYIHFVGSLHYYLRNEDKLRSIANFGTNCEFEMPKMPCINIEQDLQKLYEVEEELRNGIDSDNSINPYFDFFIGHLQEYHLSKSRQK